MSSEALLKVHANATMGALAQNFGRKPYKPSSMSHMKEWIFKNDTMFKAFNNHPFSAGGLATYERVRTSCVQWLTLSRAANELFHSAASCSAQLRFGCKFSLMCLNSFFVVVVARRSSFHPHQDFVTGYNSTYAFIAFAFLVFTPFVLSRYLHLQGGAKNKIKAE